MSERSDAPGAAAASNLAKNELRFNIWAQHVQLDLNVRTILPKTLATLLEDCEKIPRWVAKPDSSRYTYCSPVFQPMIQTLQQFLPPDYPHLCDDEELSKDVSYVIDAILRICKHSFKDFSDSLPAPTEADRRCPVDNLMSCTWNDHKSGHFQFREECSLQLPARPAMLAVNFPTKAQPHSSVFIKLENWDVAMYLAPVTNACSVLNRGVAADGYRRALHWVSEFTGDKGSGNTALRQAMIAITPGLYQRRALGFKSHFLFMTVHRPATFLRVYAATWQEGATSTTTVNTMGPPSRNNTDNIPVARGPSNPSLPPIKLEQDPARSTPEPSSEPGSEKIVFYQLGEDFDMRSPLHMLRYYLLMNAAGKLAQEYKKQIEKEYKTQLIQQIRDSYEYYEWPGQLRSRGSDTSMHSNVPTPQGSLPRVGHQQNYTSQEEHGPYEEISHEPDVQTAGVEDTGGSLEFPQVEQLGSVHPDCKVRNYLVNSGPDIYEPLPSGQFDYD
ncbi:unnamed protein product [Rhizoctonia solani]|uniref:Uncharacterized protein n=2 Tax=Rhizoctonia solani TaxID=456999 RepID=A0A8H3GCE3_9AGAM|nr:hypothetical protein V565_046890 [Rhizoctonia solani 123E]CAE6443414.1 unnamed protein product [Rhizoctonia solani]